MSFKFQIVRETEHGRPSTTEAVKNRVFNLEKQLQKGFGNLVKPTVISK